MSFWSRLFGKPTIDEQIMQAGKKAGFPTSLIEQSTRELLAIGQTKEQVLQNFLNRIKK
jgi:hypothetical protein